VTGYGSGGYSSSSTPGNQGGSNPKYIFGMGMSPTTGEIAPVWMTGDEIENWDWQDSEGSAEGIKAYDDSEVDTDLTFG